MSDDAEPARGTPPVLLVVDDDGDPRSDFHIYITDALHDAEVRSSPFEKKALEHVKRNRVDTIVLLDRVGAEEQSIEFLEALRRIKPDVPRVLLTGSSSAEHVIAAVNRGRIEGVYLDPFEDPRIVDHLRRLLHRRQGNAGRIPLRRKWERREEA